MIAAVVLTLLVAAFRVVLGFHAQPDTAEMQWLHNFSPLASVALCGAAFFPRKWAVLLPLGALLLSDLVLNAHYGVSLLDPRILPQYVGLGLMSWLGWKLRSNPAARRVLLGSLVGSVAFYFISNTGSWLLEPTYARSVAGWWQSLTVGLPGFTPTWMFFRNSMVSDLAFTGLFLACMALGSANWQPARQTVATV